MFASMLAFTVPSMLDLGGTAGLNAVTPLVQWTPTLAVLLAARIAGLRLPLWWLWSLAPLRARPRRAWPGRPAAGPRVRWLGIVTVAIVAVVAAHLAIVTAVGVVGWQLTADIGTIALMVVPMLALTSLAAAGEEVAWRGFLWAAWRERLGEWGTIAVTSVVWVLWHAPVLVAYARAGDMSWRGVATTLVSLVAASVLLGLARERGGNVWPTVLGHGLLNSFVVFAYVNLATSDRALTDGRFGEFHAIGLLAWAAVLTLLVATTQRSAGDRQRASMAHPISPTAS